MGTAMRELEDEQQSRVFSDPLAEQLAGPRAMAQVWAVMEVGAQGACTCILWPRACRCSAGHET
jgi:hypothetical protein